MTKIPIRNLYYLFCYAWARFPDHAAPVEVGVDNCPDLPNLFARVLINSTNRLIRRGLDRGYRENLEDHRSPRGRMAMNEVIRRQTILRGFIPCAFDELTPDVLHNQIIKSTALCLSRARELTSEHAHELRMIALRMSDVRDIRIRDDCFSRVQLSKNTGQYYPVIRQCELIFRSLMPEEHGQGTRFVNILEDEIQMSAVFEDFLKNFYAHEQEKFGVRSESWPWDGVSLEPGDQRFLPQMITDITLRSRERTIVIDAKFYKEAMAVSYGSKKIHSGNLYQLFAYMEHANLRSPQLPCDGALIYPASGEPIALRYQIRGHEVMIRAIDFTQDWSNIHKQLIAIAFEFGEFKFAR